MDRGLSVWGRRLRRAWFTSIKDNVTKIATANRKSVMAEATDNQPIANRMRHRGEGYDHESRR